MNVLQTFNRIKNFLLFDIWKKSHKEYSGRRSFFVRQLKIVLVAIKGFNNDKVQLRASALTFYSMLSVVPIVAMFFGIAKGFGYQEKLQEELYKSFEGQREVLNWIVNFANSMLENTNGGVVAGVGLVILLWSVMKVLGNIESSFNDIWHVKSSRTLSRQFTDYLSIMLFAPIFMILSSGVSVFISTSINTLTSNSTLLGYMGPAFSVLLNLVPFILVWLLFSMIYIVMPNTNVKIGSGIIAGVIAGTAFQFTQWAYIALQVGVSRYSAIYGSFAALPLFMVWMELSWLIVLFGAEISYANQSIEKHDFNAEAMDISPYFRMVLTLYIFKLLVNNFTKGEIPQTSGDIAQKLQIPNRLVREILFDLQEVNLISATVTEAPKEFGYQPARDINHVKVSDVIDLIERKGVNNFTVAGGNELNKINQILDVFRQKVKESDGNILVKDI